MAPASASPALPACVVHARAWITRLGCASPCAFPLHDVSTMPYYASAQASTKSIGSRAWHDLRLPQVRIASNLHWQAQLGRVAVHAGATLGDTSSPTAYLCGEVSYREGLTSVDVEPYILSCGGIAGPRYITVQLLGPTPRVLALQELYAFEASLPPPLPPRPPRPPPPPPSPPCPPSLPPLPPSPPHPPAHPPLVALGEWQSGFTTRYFDCCKPSCSWPQNVPQGLAPARFCNRLDAVQSADRGQVPSACATDHGLIAEAGYTCHNQSPWRDDLDAHLSYAFVATPAAVASCGYCYEIEYTGQGHYNSIDTGSARLRGKRLIVQATNSALRNLSMPPSVPQATYACSCLTTL